VIDAPFTSKKVAGKLAGEFTMLLTPFILLDDYLPANLPAGT
jgi:hypothetical protein